ncbi:MAG: FAD-dependent monooxygenase [Pseudobdellovibrio sp.]
MPSLNRTQVLIAGAGPTGLVMALWLKKRGINFRIIDKAPAPGLTSRALAVQTRTLEFYRQLGIADNLIAAGVQVKELILRRAGNEVARARFGAVGKELSPFASILFCSQDVHEALLCDILQKMGVEIERETELVEFTQDEKSVTAKIKSPHGEETLTADYLTGCDGAHSITRHKMPTEFPGAPYSQVFYVADVIATGDESTDKYVQVSVSREDFCIIMPIKSKGSIRLIGIVPPDKEKNSVIEFDDVRESVSRNTGLRVEKVNWFSVYHVHHRLAENFQHGRVFIAGDAGHIHSPAGGQGMNTGIGDAVNLAWKLSDVLQGRASEKILKTYEDERRAFAKTLLQTTDQLFKIIATRSFFGSLVRAYVVPTFFSGITRIKPALKLMFRTISQIRINYRGSFLSVGDTDNFEIQPGDRLPWVTNSTGNNFDNLKSLDWQVHVYGKATPSLLKAVKSAPVYEYEWNLMAKKNGLLEDAVYVIRPDGHVGYAGYYQDGAEIEAYFAKLKGK